MKGKNRFTKKERAEIEMLLTKKCSSDRSKQKTIRNKLRSIGFYITDFYDKNDGYNVEIFQEDIKNEKIKILD